MKEEKLIMIYIYKYIHIDTMVLMTEALESLEEKVTGDLNLPLTVALLALQSSDSVLRRTHPLLASSPDCQLPCGLAHVPVALPHPTHCALWAPALISPVRSLRHSWEALAFVQRCTVIIIPVAHVICLLPLSSGFIGILYNSFTQQTGVAKCHLRPLWYNCYQDHFFIFTPVSLPLVTSIS